MKCSSLKCQQLKITHPTAYDKSVRFFTPQAPSQRVTFWGELAYAMSWGGQGKAQGHQPNKTKKEHHKLQQSYKGIVLQK